MKALLIHLNAPFQSWGCGSLFHRRGAGAAPSKSGMGGMICAALGAAKQSAQEAEAIRRLSACRMTSYHAGGSIMADYHTVLKTRIAASGKESKDAVLTHRLYWESTYFIVVLESEHEDFLHRVADALKNPVWGGWLGRKCCIPAVPLIQKEGIMDAADAHLAALDHLKNINPGRSIEMFEEADSFSEGTDTWNDEPIGYGDPASSGREGRECKPRRINHCVISPEGERFRI